MKPEIEIGDNVSVNFHGSAFTLCCTAKVISIPCATGDSWVFQDNMLGTIHYVSEGCTVTKLVD